MTTPSGERRQPLGDALFAAMSRNWSGRITIEAVPAELFFALGRIRHATAAADGAALEGEAALLWILRHCCGTHAYQGAKGAAPATTIKVDAQDLRQLLAGLPAQESAGPAPIPVAVPTGKDAPMTNSAAPGPSGDVTLPVAPAGHTLIEAFPADAFRIAQLVKRVGTGKVEVRADSANGIVLSLDGDAICAIYVAQGTRLEGTEALNKIILLEDEATATLTVATLDPVVVRVLPYMWSKEPQHTMKLSWIGEFPAVLAEMSAEGQVAVHLATPDGDATAILSDGKCQLAFADDAAEPADMALMTKLAAPKKGVLRVWNLPNDHVSRPITGDSSSAKTAPVAPGQTPTPTTAQPDAHAPASQDAPGIAMATAVAVDPAFDPVAAAAERPAPRPRGVVPAQEVTHSSPLVSGLLGNLVEATNQHIKIRAEAVVSMLQECAANDETVDTAIDRLNELPLRGATPAHKERVAQAWRAASAARP